MSLTISQIIYNAMQRKCPYPKKSCPVETRASCEISTDNDGQIESCAVDAIYAYEEADK